ncbi:MAG: hypothetical protein ACOYCD_00235 [Kiritimatiellia bacterium]
MKNSNKINIAMVHRLKKVLKQMILSGMFVVILHCNGCATTRESTSYEINIQLHPQPISGQYLFTADIHENTLTDYKRPGSFGSTANNRRLPSPKMTLNVGEEKNVLFEEDENQPAVDATAGILKEQGGVSLKYRVNVRKGNNNFVASGVVSLGNDIRTYVSPGDSAPEEKSATPVVK